jgi:hypothetical protein
MAVQASQLPPDHPLAGCEAKLRRAQQNLELLDAGIGGYLDQHPEPIPRVGEFDDDTGEHIRWRFRPIEHPDPILGAVIGDYIHDLRSTLDHLAFELSFLDTGGKIPPRTIAFPCCRVRKYATGSPLAWDSNTTRKKLSGINARHRAMIYRAQPCYRRKDTPSSSRTVARRRRNALADLEDFWNHDKHRTLEPVASTPFDIRAEVIGIRDCEPLADLVVRQEVLGRPIEGGAEVYSVRVRPTGPNPQMEVVCRVGVLVTFRNGLPVLDVLPRLGNWVSSAIAFWASEFESPKARQLWGLPRGGWMEDVPIRMKTTIVKKNPGGTWTAHGPSGEG